MASEHDDRRAAERTPSTTFGDFRLLRDDQRLLRNGEEVRLDPKAWDLLCCLVDHAGKVLSKEDLLALVWKQVVVSDAALSQTISRLRSALGDDTRSPRYIETLHRRGIRFIAPVHRDGDARGNAAAPAGSIFIGRDAEMQRLEEAVAAAERGARQFILVSGYAGIGKTALLDRLVGSLPASWRVARAQCIEQHESPEPYLPVFTAFEHLAESGRRADVIAVLRRFAPTWLAQMPWLVDDAEVRELTEQVSAGSRARMLREMAAALGALAADQGLVLAIEDLHWSDLATLDLLAFVAQRSEPSRLVVAGNFRLSDAVALGHPVVDLARSLRAKGQCVSLVLDALSLDEVRGYVEQRFPANDFPVAFTSQLLDRTDGNPLFLKTIVEDMVETGWLVETDERWRLKETFDVHDSAIVPAGLRQMIETVIERIDAPDRRLLEAASVAGSTFASAAVAGALGDAATDLEDVERACERLVRKWHVLEPALEQRWPDGTRTARYAFRHGLYRTVLYDALAPSTRRRLHQHVGERLESAHASAPAAIAGELAAHFASSGDDPRAVRYLIAAAFAARSRFAEREAEIYLSAALRHIEGLPAGEMRDFQEAVIRVTRSLVRLVREGSKPDVEEEASIDRGLELLMAMPEQGSMFPVFRGLWGMWQVQISRCRPDGMARVAERLAAVAAASGRGDRGAEVGLANGMVALLTGRFSDAVSALGEAWSVFSASLQERERRGRPSTTRMREAGMQVASSRAWALTFAGRLEEAERARADAAALVAAGPVHPFTVGGSHMVMAATAGLLHDVKSARERNAAAMHIAEEHQLLALRDGLLLQRAWIASMAGHTRDALADLAAPAELLTIHDRIYPSMFHPLARLYGLNGLALAGAHDVALERLAALRRDCDARAVHWFDVEIARLQAELLIARDGHAAAGAAAGILRDAVALATAQGAPTLALRAALALHRIEPSQPARELLAGARAAFAAHATAPLLIEASQALDASLGRGGSGPKRGSRGAGGGGGNRGRR